MDGSSWQFLLSSRTVRIHIVFSVFLSAILKFKIRNLKYEISIHSRIWNSEKCVYLQLFFSSFPRKNWTFVFIEKCALSRDFSPSSPFAAKSDVIFHPFFLEKNNVVSDLKKKIFLFFFASKHNGVSALVKLFLYWLWLLSLIFSFIRWCRRSVPNSDQDYPGSRGVKSR